MTKKAVMRNLMTKGGDSNDDNPLVTVLDDSTNVDLEVLNEDTYNHDLSLSAVAKLRARHSLLGLVS